MFLWLRREESTGSPYINLRWEPVTVSGQLGELALLELALVEMLK